MEGEQKREYEEEEEDGMNFFNNRMCDYYLLKTKVRFMKSCPNFREKESESKLTTLLIQVSRRI